MTAQGFSQHDHHACIATALEVAEAQCRENKLQFTPVRRRVLEILLSEHRALGAYDILDILAKEGSRRQPPVAYRALEFLVAQGLVHRIEGLNAYVACAFPGDDHAPAFMICSDCNAVAEAQGDSRALQAQAKAAGFAMANAVVEVQGTCPTCQGPKPE